MGMLAKMNVVVAGFVVLKIALFLFKASDIKNEVVWHRFQVAVTAIDLPIFILFLWIFRARNLEAYIGQGSTIFSLISPK